MLAQARVCLSSFLWTAQCLAKNPVLAEAEVTAARERAHRKMSSRSSLGSELEAFSPPERETSGPLDLPSLSSNGDVFCLQTGLCAPAEG